MSLVWLITLLVFGMVAGWHQIHPLMWWLLVTFLVQDSYDLVKEKKR